jgi:hypothetical protein
MKVLVMMLLLLAANAFAQPKRFTWDTELCTISGTYNSGKFSETQLRNTMILFGSLSGSLNNYPSVWKWEDIAKLDVAALDAEYNERSEKLRSLDVVPLPYWQRVKQKQIKALEDVYKFYRTKTVAYTTPAILREYHSAPACNAKYAEPLINGGDSLLAVWLEVNKASRERNADPERLRREYEAELASPDRQKYAFMEVMAFGWGNCANAEIDRDDDAHNGVHEREFRKLFTRVREKCEMP